MTTYKRLGDYIREVNVRNSDLKVTNLLGVNLSKQFFPSIANIIGTDLSKYKVVHKNQFGCKFMSVFVARYYHFRVFFLWCTTIFTPQK